MHMVPGCAFIKVSRTRPSRRSSLSRKGKSPRPAHSSEIAPIGKKASPKSKPLNSWCARRDLSPRPVIRRHIPDQRLQAIRYSCTCAKSNRNALPPLASPPHLFLNLTHNNVQHLLTAATSRQSTAAAASSSTASHLRAQTNGMRSQAFDSTKSQSASHTSQPPPAPPTTSAPTAERYAESDAHPNESSSDHRTSPHR